MDGDAGELRRRLERLAVEDSRLSGHVAKAEALVRSRIAQTGVALERLDLEAFLLAVAAASGDSVAIRAFESKYFPAARAALRAMGIPPEMQADALSRTREALFVTRAKGVDGPRILELVGNGELSALVKVVAVRRALNLQRSERVRTGDSPDALADVIADQTSPEWGALAGQHRDLVKEAFGAAICALELEARTMLRLSLLHGLSIDDLGAMHNIHRSTAARRLAKIRDTLRAQVRRRLQDELGSSVQELESMLRVAQSRLDISLERLLAPDDR